LAAAPAPLTFVLCLAAQVGSGNFGSALVRILGANAKRHAVFDDEVSAPAALGTTGGLAAWLPMVAFSDQLD
jgi:glycerol-3-phosphate dehydrogenase